MKLIDELRRIEASKKADWGVVPYSIKPTVKAHPVIEKALQLRSLELDVKGWTEEYIGQLDPAEWGEVQSILDSHAKDEDKHDAILGYLAEYWGVTGVDEQAIELRQRWVDLPCNPLFKKTFLEAGIFFSLLPMLIRYSNHDLYTSRIAEWILSDEVRHVNSSRTLIRYFGIKGTKAIISLLQDTMRYILQSEPVEIQEQWIDRAVKIALKGKCEELSEFSIGVAVGHFDQLRGRAEVGNGYANY